MRERKLRSVVNWKWGVKAKRRKTRPTYIYTLSPRAQYTHTHTSLHRSIRLVVPLARSSNACRHDAHQLGDVRIAYFIRRRVPACVPYCVCLAVAVHKPLLKHYKCALAVRCTGTVYLRPLCSHVPTLPLFAVGNPAFKKSECRQPVRYQVQDVKASE